MNLCDLCTRNPEKCKVRPHRTDFSCSSFNWKDDPVKEKAEDYTLEYLDELEHKVYEQPITARYLMYLVEEIIRPTLEPVHKKLFDLIYVDRLPMLKLVYQEFAPWYEKHSGTFLKYEEQGWMHHISKLHDKLLTRTVNLFRYVLFCSRAKNMTQIIIAGKNLLKGQKLLTSSYDFDSFKSVKDFVTGLFVKYEINNYEMYITFWEGIRVLYSYKDTRSRIWKSVSKITGLMDRERRWFSDRTKDLIKRLWDEYRLSSIYKSHAFLDVMEPPKWFIEIELGMQFDDELYLLNNRLFVVKNGT